MNKYETVALAAAQMGGKTSEQVDAMTYSQIAALAKVVIEPNGTSPTDFIYKHVRRHVAEVLANNEREANITDKLTAVTSATLLSPKLRGMHVVRAKEPRDGSVVLVISEKLLEAGLPVVVL